MSKNKNLNNNRKIDGAKMVSQKSLEAPVKLNTETIQQSVPIIAVHEKYGLIETYTGCFVKSYYIGDNNYLTAPDEDQLEMFAGWRRVLNSFGNNMEFAVTINNRTMNEDDIREANMMKETGDEFDYLRKQMNQIIMDRVSDGKNSIRKDKYLTIAVHESEVSKAALVFNRLDRDIDRSLIRIGSSARPVKLEDMLEILYGIYNDPSEHFIQKTKVFDDEGKTVEISSFDFDNMRKLGLTINDLIGPTSIEIMNTKMRMGSKWVRALRLVDMPSQMNDEFISNVTDMGFNCITTINYKSMSPKEADVLVTKNLSLIRDEKTKQIRKGQKNGIYDDSFVNPELMDREAEALTLRDDMHENDEKLFKTTLSVVIFAEDEAKLEQYTDTVVTEYKKASALLNTMINQQEEGFNSTLPLCYNQIKAKRTLKSSSAAILLPFNILELNDPGGINYSCNLVSKNLLVYDRLSSQNFNGFILGTPGCADCETEFFNGKEWKSIADYQEGEQVLQFDVGTNEATLVEPLAYIKKPCDKMYHFETKYGINQTLSEEHRVIYYNRNTRTNTYSEAKEISMKELAELQNSGKFHGMFKTDFKYNGTGIDLSDIEIKIMLAVICDGSFNKNNPNSLNCRFNLKKKRKIDELRSLLEEYGVDFNNPRMQGGYTAFSFKAPRREKTFLPYWYNCNTDQLKLICDNILKWDGRVDAKGRKSFSTTIKENADFIQFVFSACGYRATIYQKNRTGEPYTTAGKEYIRKHTEYTVCISDNTMVGMAWHNDGRDTNVIVEEVVPEDGYKYCFTVPTHALVLRRNGKIFISGNSGKSFSAKLEMLSVFLKTNADIIVIDPENEYGPLAQLLGGEVIKITPGGSNHINPLDLAYTDNNGEEEENSSPINSKADFILRIAECILKSPFGISSIQETIVDECVHEIYAPFIGEDGEVDVISPDQMPTLSDLQKLFAQRREPEARELAMALKLYTGDGSLNVFGSRTNVDTKSRFVVYQIKDVGDRLKNLAMLTILDHIWNKIVENRKIGKATWFYVDEIYLLFQNEYSASFLNTLFRRARKYMGVPTGITQNVTPLLESPTARDMLQNCNFIQILKQAGPDRERLKDILNLSDTQIGYITSSPKGQGLLYTGSAVVPFYSTFPKNNDCYRALTSDAREIKQIEAERKREAARQNKEVE